MIYISKHLQDRIDLAMGNVKYNWLPLFNVDYKEEVIECKFIRMTPGPKPVYTKIFQIKLNEILREDTHENRIVSLIINCCDDAMQYEAKL